MSKHITAVEDIWNDRVSKRMKKMELSQSEFLARYKKKGGKGSQPDVSKWMHVGSIDGRTGKPRNFPTFETMKRIADVLEVSVGYLIGETDFESFDMEKTVAYTGLSEEAIKGIRDIITGKSIPPFYKYPDSGITSALEILLSTPSLIDYLKKICELAESIDNEKNPKEYMEKELKKVPEHLRNDVWELWYDPENAVEELGIEFTEEKRCYVEKIDDAVGHDMVQEKISELSLNANRYVLAKAHEKMIDDIMSSDKMKKMLFMYSD